LWKTYKNITAVRTRIHPWKFAGSFLIPYIEEYSVPESDKNCFPDLAFTPWDGIIIIEEGTLSFPIFEMAMAGLELDGTSTPCTKFVLQGR
jgi:hypothetical protein